MWTKRVISAGLTLVGTLALIECSDSRPGSTAPDSAAQNAVFGGRSIERVPIAEIASYAGTLRFENTAPGSDAETIRGERGESVRLDVEPVANASEMSERDRVAGRIVAQVRSNVAYAPLGLAAGVTYMWVEGDGSHARTVMIPADGSTRSVRPLILRHHAFGNYTLPTSRVVRVPGVSSPFINTRCSDACCTTGIPQIPDSQMALLDAALLDMHRHIASAAD